jgi:hypothetical protein
MNERAQFKVEGTSVDTSFYPAGGFIMFKNDLQSFC